MAKVSYEIESVDSLRAYYAASPITFLSLPNALTLIAHVSVVAPSDLYLTGVNNWAASYPNVGLSDTVCQRAFNMLVEWGVLGEPVRTPVTGRGTPRKIYAPTSPEAAYQLQLMASMWANAPWMNEGADDV